MRDVWKLLSRKPTKADLHLKLAFLNQTDLSGSVRAIEDFELITVKPLLDRGPGSKAAH